MKHAPSDKYTIAWFKLAEFVARGEKEKALGIYKLLALSINDLAFTIKLEGDILYSFNDKSAEDKYYKAAILYNRDQKFFESAAIFENLTRLNPESETYLNKLLEIYKNLNLNSKIVTTYRKLFGYFFNKKEFKKSIEILEDMENISSDYTDLFEKVIFELINHNGDNNTITKYINKTLNIYFNENKKNNLQQFLSKLEVTNKMFYNEALKQIKY